MPANDERNPSRRQLLAGAGVMAVASLASTAAAESRDAATTQPNLPRLPKSVLLRAGLSSDRVEKLRARPPDLTMSRHVDLASADAVFGNVSRDELARAAKRKWLQIPSAGVEHAPLEELIARDVTLTNAQGCYGPEIAEHAFGLLFALTRGIAHQARARKWGYVNGETEPMPLLEMGELTLGVIGLGGIGREVARRAKAMDMTVLAVDAEPLLAEKFASCVDEVALVDDGLHDLLARADVVVCCAPHTPRSRAMLGAEQFAAMRKGAYFINVSRGKLAQTDALVEALQSGHLAGAGLDVTDPEPLPAGHPLWEMPHVVITSHVAGRSQRSWDRVQEVFVENVTRLARGGRPLLNVVDKAKGF
jgi:phosphoglycerate dehydrogenase-like enzyme